jgi:hypothetical protein
MRGLRPRSGPPVSLFRSASAFARFCILCPAVPPFHRQARFTSFLHLTQARSSTFTVLSFFPALLRHRREAIRAPECSARNRACHRHRRFHHPSQCLHCRHRSAIVSVMSFGAHLTQVHTARPNPALKRTPRARGFATVPGSRLACIR